jgi:hypothetical protein
MAQIVGGKVQLNNGQLITPQTGGWYDGMQYWNGSLSAPGVINSQSNQQGAGQKVSNEVIAQTNPANVPYIQQQQQQYQPTATSQPLPGGSSATPASAAATSLAGPTAAPAFDLVAATNAAYNTPEITAATKAVNDRKAALATALAGENDNPFYSEATRVGKISKLEQSANNDIGVQEGILSGLKADAQIKLNAQTGQYNINRQAYQDTLSQFNTLLQAGAFTNASPQDLATISVQTGIPMSELQSIQTKQKNDNIKTSLVTSDNGVVSVINTQTGEIISQTKPGVGNVQKSATATSGQSKSAVIADVYGTFQRIAGNQGYVSKEDWAKMKQAVLNSGLLTASEFNSNFATFTNPNGAKAGYNYQ